jgi:hypothetical protein
VVVGCGWISGGLGFRFCILLVINYLGLDLRFGSGSFGGAEYLPRGIWHCLHNAAIARFGTTGGRSEVMVEFSFYLLFLVVFGCLICAHDLRVWTASMVI